MAPILTCPSGIYSLDSAEEPIENNGNSTFVDFLNLIDAVDNLPGRVTIECFPGKY